MVSSRDRWSDYAKAFGIILVVYGHVARGIVNAGIDGPMYWYLLADSVVYSFHMPLFFFLSGVYFCRSASRKGAPRLALSKVDTIFYPFVFWSILQGCLEVILSEYTNGDVSFKDVFSLIWAPRAQFWFLHSLFIVFLFASLIHHFIPQRNSISILLILSVFLYLYPASFSDIYIFRVLDRVLVFFYFGLFFSEYLNLENFSRKKFLLGSFVAFGSAQWFYHCHLNLRFNDIGIASLLLALVSIIFVVSLCANIAKIKFTLLGILGSLSLQVYLMHTMAGAATRIFMQRLLDVDSYALYLFFGLTLSILMPVVAVKILERYKIQYLFSAPVSDYLIKMSGQFRRSQDQ